MENLKSFINESIKENSSVEIINEGFYQHFEENVKSANKNKFGFMRYDTMDERIEVISFNTLKEIAHEEGFDEEDYMEIDKLDVGESAYDGASTIYTRIW